MQDGQSGQHCEGVFPVRKEDGEKVRDMWACMECGKQFHSRKGAEWHYHVFHRRKLHLFFRSWPHFSSATSKNEEEEEEMDSEVNNDQL